MPFSCFKKKKKPESKRSFERKKSAETAASTKGPKRVLSPQEYQEMAQSSHMRLVQFGLPIADDCADQYK